MNIVNIIEKKRDNQRLSTNEIEYAIQGYASGDIPDYQISPLLMAIYLNGMDIKEISDLTHEIVKSGEQIDLSRIEGVKVDKHSTGGVGDKTSLVLAPLVASVGCKVAKMSGRGLGITGGTLDKLEAIPNFNINLKNEEFINQVQEIGISIIGQSEDVCLADKKMYALRDVTGTIAAVPLIASSIMSKKLAAGSDVIALDVKYGSGAFMKTFEEAKELAKVMVGIGKEHNVKVSAFISNMTEPLGKNIGNSLEIIEAVETLKGNGPSDLLELCLEIGAKLVVDSQIVTTKEEAKELLNESIASGKALAKFEEFVKAQNGEVDFLEDYSKLGVANNKVILRADQDGFISSIDASSLGKALIELGGGRHKKEDSIDYTVGFEVIKKVGNQVTKGEELIIIHSNLDDEQQTLDLLKSTITISKEKVPGVKIIEDIVE